MRGLAIRILLAVSLLAPAWQASAAPFQLGLGREYLIGFLEDLASSGDQKLQIGGIEGASPANMTFVNVTLADRDGVWLTIDRLTLQWSPLKLALRQLEVDQLVAGTITVSRKPLPGPPAEPTPSSGGFSLPQLPVSIDLRKFGIGEIALAEPVLGEAARFSIAGKGQLPRGAGNAANLELTAKRTDGAAGSVEAALAYVPAENRLQLDASVEEPAGGMIARAAAIPGLPPVSLKLTGNGPLGEWKGRLDARAGEDVRLGADAQISAIADGYGIVVDASGSVAGLLDPSLAPLVQDGVTVALRANTAPAGQIRIETLQARAVAGTATARGAVNTEADTIEIAYEVTAGDSAPFAALSQGARWASLKLEGQVKGTLSRPSLETRLIAEQVSAATVAAERINATVTATPSGDKSAEGALGLAGSVAAQNLLVGDPGLDPLLAGAVEARFAGSFAPPSGRLAVDRLVVTLPFASLEGSGAFDTAKLAGNGLASLTVADLSRFEGLAGAPLRGAAELALEGEYRTGVVNAKLGGTLTDLKMGQAGAEQALGNRIELAAEVATLPDGAIELSRFAIQGAQLEATASGRIQDQQVAGQWSFDLRQISAVVPSASGRIGGEGKVSGTVSDFAVEAGLKVRDARANGISIARLDIAADAAHLPAAPEGSVKLSGIVAGKPTEAVARFDRKPEGAAKLEGVALSHASLRLTGGATMAADGLITGKLEGRAGNLADLSPFVGQPLAGSADLAVTLAPANGGQNASLTLDGRNFAVADQARMRRVSVKAAVSDAFGTPSVDARLEASAVQAGGLDLGALGATVNGGQNAFNLTAKVAGKDLLLDTRARIGLEPTGPRIALAALNGRFKQQPFNLGQPAAIALTDGGVTVSNFALIARPGRLAVDGALTERSQDLRVTIAELPLALARLAQPDAAYSGSLNGEIRLAGTRAAPDGRFDLRVRNAKASAAPTVPPINAATKGTWRNGRLQLNATADAGMGGKLAITGDMPLVMDPATGVPSVPQNQPLRFEANGGIDLAPLNDLLAAGADQLAGRVDLRLRVGGTLANLQTDGGATLANGSYTNVVYGVRLTEINAALTGSRERLVVSQLTASTPNGGKVRGSGAVVLNADQGFPADIQIVTENATLIDSDLASVTADSNLALRGPVLRTAGLAGTVTLQRAEIRVPDRLPASVKKIEVREVNVPPEMAARKQAEQAPPPDTMRIGLDLKVKAPSRVYVRGRGINAELGGDLAVTGTSNEPAIVGALQMRRGTLDVVGRRLNFDRGAISFSGSTDAALDLIATTKVENFTVQVAVTGRTSAPQFKLSSQPPLPEDEVLALFLFGKSVGELTALEAIRLGQAAAQLAGVDSGGSVLDKVRDTLGLDRFDVGAGEGGKGAGVSAGRYVSDQVFVGVKQGLDANSSRVTVQVDVTDHIKVESDIGAVGGNRIGVSLEWNY